MTKEELIKFHKAATDHMHETLKRKNADYTGANANPFSNFTTVEELSICSSEQGFLTRMTDKFKRIVSFVQLGVLQVKDESVTDTLIDLANYCLLMAAYIQHKREHADREKKGSVSNG